MKDTNWKDVAELIGIAAIVASLIFVGLQMKQSQEIAIAGQYHERAALDVDHYTAQLESGDLRMWATFSGQRLSSEWTAEDAGRLFLTGVVFLTMADNHYYQYQSGFMEEGAWQGQRWRLKTVLGFPESPAAVAFASTAPGLRPAFGELCELLIEENRLAAEN